MQLEGGASPDAGRGLGDDRLSDEALLLLLRFFVDLQRGMEEFRRAFGLEGAGLESAAARPEPAGTPGGSGVAAGAAPQSGGMAGPAGAESWILRLSNPATGPGARREIEEKLREIRVHFAALLEGYQRAVQDGSTRLLETLDPETIRRESGTETVQVGPLRLSSSWRPVLVQAIWEETLRRHAHYRSLEPADFERLFREGFREGYRGFVERHGSRGGAPGAREERPQHE